MASVPGSRQSLQRGERVFLRRPRMADEREFCRLRAASTAFLRRWEPRNPDTGKARREAFRSMLHANKSKRHEKLLVCANDDGRILGYVAINEIVRGALMSGYLGYWIGARYAKRGFMTEALELALRHAFGKLGLHRVEANVIPGNVPSLRLVARAGFQKEGLSRRYLKIAGRWQDHERWALLAEEFDARHD